MIVTKMPLDFIYILILILILILMLMLMLIAYSLWQAYGQRVLI